MQLSMDGIQTRQPSQPTEGLDIKIKANNLLIWQLPGVKSKQEINPRNYTETGPFFYRQKIKKLSEFISEIRIKAKVR
jgi:hypothetical protein